jgi:hypothetical protein
MLRFAVKSCALFYIFIINSVQRLLQMISLKIQHMAGHIYFPWYAIKQTYCDTMAEKSFTIR